MISNPSLPTRVNNAADRILGLDPGLARVGFAVLEATPRSQQLLAFGTVTTRPQQARGERLVAIAEKIEQLIKKFRPDAVAIEQLFFQTNVTTAMAVSESRGVLLLCCAKAGLPVVEFTPNEVKRIVTGTGAADKRAVGKMIKLILKLETLPRDDDAADAVAIALSAALHSPRRHGTR